MGKGKAPLGRRKLWRLAYHRLHKLGLIPAAFLVDHPAVTGLWDEKSAIGSMVVMFKILRLE